VATAGLTIQIPLAAVVDTLAGNAPTLTDYIGAAAIMVGFAGINIPSDIVSSQPKEVVVELGKEATNDRIHILSDTKDATENLELLVSNFVENLVDAYLFNIDCRPGKLDLQSYTHTL